jgi:phosphoribosylanthranilate isomerase
MRTRVKICGITRPEDGLAAANLGADAIGLVFYEPSPRNVSVEQARAILRKLPPFVTVVGLFVNPMTEKVWDVLDRVPLDVLQFHGDEKPETCERFDMPYIKALRVRAGDDLSVAIKSYSTAQGILLDTHVEGLAGGSGQTFDWGLVPDDIDKPVILAGGLTPDNVAQAVRQVQPYAVDVSGGVEADKGIKDAAKIEAFVQAVSSAT